MPNSILNKAGEPITYKRDKYESIGFNAELAHEVLDVIRAFPDNHDQSAWCTPGPATGEEACETTLRDEFIEDPIETAWSCGTGMCFAGWAVALGVGLDWDERAPGQPWSDPGVVGGVEGPRLSGSSIAEAARQLLGITYSDAYKLFESDNTLDDLEHIVARLERKYAEQSS